MHFKNAFKEVSYGIFRPTKDIVFRVFRPTKDSFVGRKTWQVFRPTTDKLDCVHGHGCYFLKLN